MTARTNSAWLNLALLPAWKYSEGSLARANCDAINEEIIRGFEGLNPSAFRRHHRGAIVNAEDIVRALAAIEDPTVSDRDYAPASDCGLCSAPEGPGPSAYDHWLNDPTRHEPSCPWRLAREWVEEHA